MPSKEIYKKRLGANQMGKAMKWHSDLQMEASWNADLQAKECYIYDYYHDSEPDLNKGLSSSTDPQKTRIDAKYIVTQYPTLSKDQVEYHIMFRPSQKNPLSYFDTTYSKYKTEFPIGLFIDIPDNTGVYNRWMICSRDYEQQFVKYSVLPCNYHFKWIYEYQKYEMWGVARMRNSLRDILINIISRCSILGNFIEKKSSNCWNVLRVICTTT